MASFELDIAQLNLAQVYFALELPQALFYEDVGPTVSPHDQQAVKLLERLSGLRLAGVQFCNEVVIRVTERIFYLSQDSVDQDLFKTKGAIITIVELINQAVCLLKNNAHQPEGPTPIDVLIKSGALRKLLVVLADCNSLGAKLFAVIGAGEVIEIPLPDSAWLASPPTRKSVFVNAAEVTGVNLGLTTEHGVELNRTSIICVCTDILTARSLLANPHSFTGTLIRAGSKKMVDVSKPWRFDPIPVQTDFVPED